MSISLTTINNSFFRFLLIGLLNSLFGFIVYGLLALTALETWKVLLLSNLFGVIFNFFSIRHLVFFNKKHNPILKFLLSYGLTYFTYLALITFLEPIVGNRITAMGLIVFPVAVLNYLIQKFFVFIK